MSALLSGYITLEKLKQIVSTVEAKQAKGFAFTMSINETTNDYGQNASLYAEQTKEDREAQKPKWYFGNGKVFWTDGVITTAKKESPLPNVQQSASTYVAPTDTDDLPF